MASSEQPGFTDWEMLGRIASVELSLRLVERCQRAGDEVPLSREGRPVTGPAVARVS